MPEEGSTQAAAPRNVLERFLLSVTNVLQSPAIWFRETIVEPNQKPSVWYHQKFRRVPTIDECYTDDQVCITEADIQFKRDRLVDSEIVAILRSRFEDCTLYEAPDHLEKCHNLWEIYNDATTNYFIKYGDLGGYATAKSCLMKQKHRMIWERRHGPVGSGMNNQ
ncbi:unnamed protein product [Phyllotreta striolata]|uniref:NADH dehydrogenase [ubiquinone] 1 beta subcomplex subunit 10 n=1 Tax=Phyllotreta striolata TaxID=444603 RepID=A0A9N9TY34_PHYSR|nr:unnamed protein product [Phyllotreta striolata]